MSKKNNLIFGILVILFSLTFLIFLVYQIIKDGIQLVEFLSFVASLSNLVLGFYFTRAGIKA